MEFIVNDCGVVINSNKYQIIENGADIEIRTAKINGHWLSSVSANFKNQGFSSLPSIYDKDKFETEKEAFKFSVNYLRNFISRNLQYSNFLDDIYASTEKYFPSSVQLELF